jgi:hypothetical protein
MARRTLRDRFFTPQVAHAITSPSGILIAGGAAAVAIAAGAGAAVIGGAAAAAWAVRVAVSVPRNDAAGKDIDPFALKDPWRRFIRQALQAQRRYEAAVRSSHAGPLRDRLFEIGGRVDDGVKECWRIAKQGQVVADARAQVDTISATKHVARLSATNAPPDGPVSETLDALHAQLASAKRMDDTITDVSNRLQLLDARLDEAVARAVELSVQASDLTELGGLGDDVEGVVGDMEALRQGLEETERPAGS